MPAADRMSTSITPSPVLASAQRFADTHPPTSAHRTLRRVGLAAGILATAAVGGAALWTARNTFHNRLARMATDRAGFVTRTTMVNGHTLRFAEGPASGPPLLLIHAQSTDLWSWAPVLPALARDFHVFAVDVPGHGGSEWDPELYNGPVLGELLADFIAGVIGEQTVVAGHSSGGLIAAWMGAARPDEVLAVVLEDPPFFSSVMPRAEVTWNHVELAQTCHDFITADAPDFVEFLLEHSRLFDFFGPSGEKIRADALRRRRRHPHRPVALPYVPPAMNEIYRALDHYDPMFGCAFFDGSFHDLFDHAETLSALARPALLIHCTWQARDGILLGAMDDADAARAAMLIPDVRAERSTSGHGFHTERPRDFVKRVRAFARDVIDEVDILE